jgi:thiol-disulfide isomerase/thioredoxin
MRGSSSPKQMSKKSFFSSKTFYIFLGLLFVCFVLYVVIKPTVEYFENSSNKSLKYFYMNGCPHCEEFDPIWEDAIAKIAKDHNIKMSEIESNSVMNFKKFNAESDEAKKYKITSFPTVLYVDTSVEEYNNGRNVDSIVKFVKCKIEPKSCVA